MSSDKLTVVDMHTGGEPFHQTTCMIDGVTHLEHRCATCIDHYSRAMWPEDDWGPYPKMPIPNMPGTA